MLQKTELKSELSETEGAVVEPEAKDFEAMPSQVPVDFLALEPLESPVEPTSIQSVEASGEQPPANATS